MSDMTILSSSIRDGDGYTQNDNFFVNVTARIGMQNKDAVEKYDYRVYRTSEEPGEWRTTHDNTFMQFYRTALQEAAKLAEQNDDEAKAFLEYMEKPFPMAEGAKKTATTPKMSENDSFTSTSIKFKNKYYSLYTPGNYQPKCCDVLGELLSKLSYVLEIRCEAPAPTAPKPDDSGDTATAGFYKSGIKDNWQVIFTGAPGTGKTYGVRDAIRSLTAGDEKRVCFIQFHSSYDYSDFVEGLRPVEIDGKPTFVRCDGHFKAFCRKIVEDNLKRLKEEGINNISDLKDACSLPAETGKILSDKEKNELSAKRERRKKIKDRIAQKHFYYVIDEINRADIGRVFGELMFGLEEDYRGAENRFPTQYHHLRTYCPEKKCYYGETGAEADVFADGFFIPENLHLVGTMNDIDRTVESFDFALRRRFRWIDVKANDVMSDVIDAMLGNDRVQVPQDKREELTERAFELNDVISDKEDANGGGQFGLTEAFHMGPAYFKTYRPGGTKKEEEENLLEIWTQRIEPILREYVRGRNPEDCDNFIERCRAAFFTKPKKTKDSKDESGADE